MVSKLSALTLGSLAILAVATAAPAAAQRYSDSFTFLEAIRKGNSTDVMRLVSEPGSTVINTRDTATGDAALHIVTRARDMNYLSFLLGKGAKSSIQNNRGETPLGLAAQLGWAEGAQVLLATGAPVDQPDHAGETPLIKAVHRRDSAMVRLLLSRGADPSRADSVAGYSALDYAKQDRRSAAILRLLQTEARPRASIGPTR